MIKRIIFDLDDTLITWKKEYNDFIKKALIDNNCNANPDYINSLFDLYETCHTNHDKKALLKFMNEHNDVLITEKIIDDAFENISKMAEPDDEVIATLEYLKEKYELVVLTRWFITPQAKRLEKAKILPYFTEVIGGDEVMKPHPDAFKKAIGPHDVSECIMVGDNYNVDLIPAFNIGIKPIFINNKGFDNPNQFLEIKTFKELKDIL